MERENTGFFFVDGEFARFSVRSIPNFRDYEI